MRAASLSIIEFISRSTPHLVLPMFTKLEAMVHDPWWEAQSQVLAKAHGAMGLGKSKARGDSIVGFGRQLLLISANLLMMLTPTQSDTELVYALVKTVLDRSHSPLVRKIGACHTPQKFTKLTSSLLVTAY